jgi:integrase
LAGGAGLKTASELLGHSTITITADTYASVLPEVAHGAAEAAARRSTLDAYTRARTTAERASLQGFAFRVIR